MTPFPREALDRLLDAALERPATERAAFVRAATADPELIAAALDVLDAGAAGPTLVTGGALPPRAVDEALAPGTVVGSFRVSAELARGGMGVVYLAARCDGTFEQEVALKVLKRGLDTDDVLRRFRRERQILARLRHPAIAKLLDGGAAPDGRPYFVMERIDGLPLDEFCAASGLDLEARIRLLIEIAAAVAHAHRNLVVHRDLKPSNILVTPDGRPHLLDFGIAGLLDPTGELAATRSDGHFLTPQWASPEQLAGEPATTLSDVFQLGLLLCSLVTGEPPAVNRGGAGGRGGAARTPPPPSAVITGRDGAASPRARRVRGDLDRIALRALAPDLEGRYPSADALAEDLERFLDGRPVRARRPTVAYRLGKLIRRHRLAAALSGLVALSLLSGVAGTLHQAAAARRAAEAAAREAQVAREVRDFMLGLFAAGDPMLASEVEPTVTELLERGAAPLLAGSPREPAVRAELLTAVGGAFVESGRFDRAEPLLREAVALLERSFGGGDPRLAEPVSRLGDAALYLGRPADAEPLYERALALREHSLAADDPEVGIALTDLCVVRIELDRLDEASQVCPRAAAVLERAGPERRRDLAAALDPLAQLHLLRGAPEEAARVRHRAVELTEAVFGRDHPATGLRLNNYGMLLLRSDARAAEEVLSRALAVLAGALGSDHPRVATVWSNLGSAHTRLGRHQEAAAAYEQALAIRRQRLGETSVRTAYAQSNLANAYHALGRSGAAEELALAAVATEEALLGPEHPSLGPALRILGQIRRDRGDFAEAEVLLRRSLAIQETSVGAREHLPGLLEELADLAERAGRNDEATTLRARAELVAGAPPT